MDRAGGVDLDGELNRAGEVVWANTDGAEEEDWASIARGRLRGDHSQRKTEVLVHLKMLNRRVWKD